MRILMANDGFGDVGGVQSYLDAVVAGLVSRGHDVAMLYLEVPSPAASWSGSSALTQFSIRSGGLAPTISEVRRWEPDVCFSHNMRDLEVESHVLAVAPVVKFMHGYLGTCISGQKMFAFPTAQPCDRTFGAPCAALYLPRRCGEFGVATLIRQYGAACDQRDLFARYRAIVVASEHMKREFVKNGADARGVHVNPLFSTMNIARGAASEVRPRSVVFIGRMTALKGGDLLVRAVAEASSRLGRAIELTMMGGGPQRAEWERLAARLNVRATFVGWVDGDERWPWLQRASLLAVPSVWPEPFGLVGLEAAALGVPAIAFDVGGIREWLVHGENGYLVAGDPPRASSLADGLVEAFGRPDELDAMRCGAVKVAKRMSLDRHLDRLEHVLRNSADSPGR